jgi:hypothetical protein
MDKRICKLFWSTRDVCGRCSGCQGFPTGVVCYGKTVRRMRISSRAPQTTIVLKDLGGDVGRVAGVRYRGTYIRISANRYRAAQYSSSLRESLRLESWDFFLITWHQSSSNTILTTFSRQSTPQLTALRNRRMLWLLFRDVTLPFVADDSCAGGHVWTRIVRSLRIQLRIEMGA